jgi:hypothetical protein
MNSATVVRRMLESDLNFAGECTANEGWSSEIRTEFEGFLAFDPKGCFVAETGGQ